MKRLALLLACALSLPALAQADAGRRPRVAVRYFEANTRDEEMVVFTKGLAALVIADLTVNPQLQVLERERLEAVQAELALGETRLADKATFARVGQLLGAEYQVVGSLVGFRDRYQLVARIILSQTGEEAGSAKVAFGPDDVFAAEEKLVAALSEGLLKHGIITAAPQPPAHGYALPVSTAKKYARALDAKDRNQPEQARKLLTQVVAEQPKFQLAQLDLANLTR